MNEKVLLRWRALIDRIVLVAVLLLSRIISMCRKAQAELLDMCGSMKEKYFLNFIAGEVDEVFRLRLRRKQKFAYNEVLQELEPDELQAMEAIFENTVHNALYLTDFKAKIMPKLPFKPAVVPALMNKPGTATADESSVSLESNSSAIKVKRAKRSVTFA